MSAVAPITAAVTAFSRLNETTATLERILACVPPPAQLLVHVDGNNRTLARIITEQFPQAEVLISEACIGPGGGRTRMVGAAKFPLVASFDDDAYPLDRDYFAQAIEVAAIFPEAVVIMARQFLRGAPIAKRQRSAQWVADYSGAACLFRKDAFLDLGGHVPLPLAYGMEEVDLALRSCARGYRILETSWLRALHDTDLSHRMSSASVAATVANVALFGYLRYPRWLWPLSALQLLNRAESLVRTGHRAGIGQGFTSVPRLIRQFGYARKTVSTGTILRYLRMRRRPVAAEGLEALHDDVATSAVATSPLTATVVIVTHNRKDELRGAVASAVRQSCRPDVLVIDDGSVDGTADMVAAEWPDVRLVRHAEAAGYVVRRNQAAQLATSDVIVSIDDDSELVSETIVEDTLKDFDDPLIGAVAIPYIEPNKRIDEFQRAPDDCETWITDSFVGTAHAIRKDVFLSVGGYRADLVHQGEERDFCLRMLAANSFVRLGRSGTIRHDESPKRDFRRMDYHGRRNDIVFVWHNVPMPYAIVHILGTTVYALRSAWRAGRLWAMLRGVAAGYREVLTGRVERAPVSGAVYRLHRRLRSRGPVRLECLIS